MKTRISLALLVSLQLGASLSFAEKKPSQENPSQKKPSQENPSPQKLEEAMPVSIPKAPWRIDYHDGSGNGFSFWQETAQAAIFFEYDPVTPAMSSSGIYSGGQPKNGALDHEQTELLWQHARQLQENLAIRATSRKKGTGSLAWQIAEEKTEFIIENGRELQEFHQFLAAFRG